MKLADFHWQFPSELKAEQTAELESKVGLPAPIAAILYRLGYQTFDQAKWFLKPQLADLHDPFLLKDMDRAIERLNTAKRKGETIMVYGDYDVDGSTALSLMASYLKAQGFDIRTYQPDRYKEGYGVSLLGIDQAEAWNCSLIIALDCGIKALKQVAYAREKGIDFIIGDHHTPGESLPAATAIINPKRTDCSYPDKDLSGCGVGFKICAAYSQAHHLDPQKHLQYLDLLAISIAADIVPMRGENRILCYYGLKMINKEPSPGVKALCEIAGAKLGQLNVSDLVFKLAPRINAAGRLAHASLAVKLLMGEAQPDEIEQLAEEINRYNDQRKTLDQSITQEALAQIESESPADAHSTVVFQADWHKGVIGIVASRLIEHYYRPTVVLCKSGDKIVGSARSVEGFDLYHCLTNCAEQMIQFGGHFAAAGMTLRPDQLADFKKQFERSVAQHIRPEQKKARLLIDAVIEPKDLDERFYRLLQYLAPHGPENQQPVLVCHHLIDNGSRLVGEEGKHLKLSLVNPEDGICLEGIGFGMGAYLELLQSGKEISLAFHLELNEFRGTQSLQMMVKDIKATDELLAEDT